MSEEKLRTLSKEDLVKYKNSHYLTVGRLLEFIKEHSIPEDALIVTQRIEDVYYKKHNWGVYTKPGYGYHSAVSMNQNMNEEIDRRAVGDEPNFGMENPADYITPESVLEELKEQYTPVWCPVLYKDDKDDILFLDLHY